MTNFKVTVALPALIASLLVGCVSDGTDDAGQAPGTTAPGTPSRPQDPSFTPSTCQEVVDHDASATDGDVTLYIQNQASLPWTAYCADLQTDPREYLTLTRTGGGKNTSMYAAGTGAAGTDVVTEYRRVRIDPSSLSIDIRDTTFATSRGSLMHAGTISITSVPFGVAMTCGELAAANIDLTGTPFRAEDAFPVNGANLSVSYALSTDRKSLDLTADGACGWVGPQLANPLDTGSDYALRLAYGA